MSRQTEVFARRSREERRKAGHSQALIADRMSRILGANVDTSAVSRIENPYSGRVTKLDEAAAIAEALGVPLSELMADRSATDEEIAALRTELEEARAIEAELHRARMDAQERVCSISRRLRYLNAPPTE